MQQLWTCLASYSRDPTPFLTYSVWEWFIYLYNDCTYCLKFFNSCSLSSEKYLSFIIWYVRYLMISFLLFLLIISNHACKLISSLDHHLFFKIAIFVLLYIIFFHLQYSTFQTSYLLIIFRTRSLRDFVLEVFNHLPCLNHPR